MFQWPLLAPFDEGPNRRRRRIDDVHSMALDDVPETIRLWPVGRAFVHQRRGAVRKRTVNDVTVARHPPNISRAPVEILVLYIKDPFGS